MEAALRARLRISPAAWKGEGGGDAGRDRGRPGAGLLTVGGGAMCLQIDPSCKREDAKSK